MGHWAEDELHRFYNNRGHGKITATVHKCPTCHRRVHFVEYDDGIHLADNVNGEISRHVCKMKFK